MANASASRLSMRAARQEACSRQLRVSGCLIDRIENVLHWAFQNQIDLQFQRLGLERRHYEKQLHVHLSRYYR